MQIVSRSGTVTDKLQPKLSEALDRLCQSSLGPFCEYTAVHGYPSQLSTGSKVTFDSYLKLDCSLPVNFLKESQFDSTDWVQAVDWAVIMQDRPSAPNKNGILSKSVLTGGVIRGNAFALMEQMGYVHTSSYITRGFRWRVSSSISAEVYRIWCVPEAASLDIRGECDLLDESRSWIFESKIKLQSTSEQDNFSNAEEELKQFSIYERLDSM